jgi:hypothetical protein
MKKEPTSTEGHGRQPSPTPHPPIVKPILDELTKKPGPPEPSIPPPGPPKPAELDQDPGGGFNRDHTDIQT